MEVKVVNCDSSMFSSNADLMLTDPPYDMDGKKLSSIINRYNVEHLILLTTMRQLLDFLNASAWELSFDFVIDAVMPKQSKQIRQPNYTHQTGVYLKKGKSIFNRKLRERSDVFTKGYWPTILRAPRENLQEHGMAKNLNIITDILGSFEAKSVVDPFGGIGTTALAAHELGFECTIIEKEKPYCDQIIKNLKFVGAHINYIEIN